jgi:DNA-binding MarR family transcriptional regulator
VATILEPRSGVLPKLSFVLSSTQREKVLASVLAGPKTPAQISRETALRLPHVSRALSQLAQEGLVAPLNAGRRGKLYGPSELGRSVFEELSATRGDRLVAPLGRGTHLRNYHHWLRQTYGRKRADELFRSLGVDLEAIDPDAWYPLRKIVQVLDSIDSTFGDGSGSTVRQMLRDETGNFPSVRRLIARVVPLRFMLEMAPNAYNREFNHGRLEVEAQGRSAVMKNYDWISSPARCMAWLGTYEGGLSLLRVHGKVSKVACILRGDQYCGYLLEW